VRKLEAILQQLEEIEDHMEAARRLESPPAGWHDTAWLCRVVRELLARSERLEAVAEAARELKRTAALVSATYIGTEISPERECVDVSKRYWNQLIEALASLEEERG